jgi:dTDP-4-dehydrorhamnose reductase
MKNILITGANGQLGNEIRELEPDFSEFILYYTDIDKLDITNLNSLNDFFNRHRIDIVINCAAYTAVDKAESDQIQADFINHKAVENLRIVTEKHSAYLFHISSDYVFDGRKCSPYTEDDPTNPLSAYGLSKLKGEEVIKDYEKALIIRTSWLFSSFGHNFVKTILRLTDEKNEIKVVFDQIGSPTYAADLAKTLLTIAKIINDTPQKFVNGIFNYSNEGVCSWYDFAYHIAKIAKRECKIIPIETKDFPSPATRPLYSVFNKNKIKNTYNIEISHWLDALERCMSLIKIKE